MASELEVPVSKDQRETGRTEAFSDGVIAFAITLLVINLKDPVLLPKQSLFGGLVSQWPSFFAFVTSFATILIMWVNHHNMFTFIRRVDTTLMFLNGLLLFFIVLTAFTTLLVANHVGLVQTDDGRTAAAVYAGNATMLGLVWTTVSYYVAKKGLVPAGPGGLRYLVGPVPYLAAFGVSFASAFASLVVVLIIAGFWTLASRGFWRTSLTETA